MAGKTLFDQGKLPPTPELVQGFLEFLKTEKAASDHTLINYEIDLRTFLKFLFETGKPFSVALITDMKVLRAYLAKSLEKFSRATVARRLSVIKGFLKFLHREGYIEKNIAKLISLPRQEQKLPHVLNTEDAIRLLDGIPTDTLRQKRMRAIVELLYSTGIRVSELQSLTYEKIDFRGGTLTVFGKGSKERVVPMGRHCQNALKDYVDSVPQMQKRGVKTPLFLNQHGEAISVRSIQRNLREFALEVLGTTGEKVTPHTLRHTCATHLLSGGAGLREIQELLGHRSLVTTQKYTQVDVERLKASYKKAHPKEGGLKPKPKEESQ